MYAITAKPMGTMLMLQVQGEILLPVAIKFQSEINALVVEKKLPEVVIDLSKTERMDNAALGVLVSLSTLYSTQGRRLYLFHPARHIEALIQEVGIEKFFPIFENLEELRTHRLNAAD